MRALLMKDLRLLAPFWWAILPMHLLWSAQAFLVPDLYFWMSLLPACGWTLVLVALDWQLDTERFVASLPTSRATLVRARYASGAAASVVALLLYVGYGYLFLAVGGQVLIERWHGTTAWASLDVITCFLALAWLFVIAFLPGCFRFGFPIGSGLFLVVVALLITLAAVVVPDDLGVASSWPGMATPSRTPVGLVRALHVSWGAVPASVALLLAAVAAGWLSLILSIRFYEAREL